MSLTSLLLLTLPNLTYAESGVDDCSESAVLVSSEGAAYVEGVGCVVDDIGELCKEKFDSDCESWVQVVTRVEAEQPEDGDSLLKDCTNPVDYYHRYDASTKGLTAYYYYDDDGFIVGASLVSSDTPFCCDGVETPTLVYGDPAATCVLRDEPDDKGDAGLSTCGGGAGGGAAVLLLTTVTLNARRRRQP